MFPMLGAMSISRRCLQKIKSKLVSMVCRSIWLGIKKEIRLEAESRNHNHDPQHSAHLPPPFLRLPPSNPNLIVSAALASRTCSLRASARSSYSPLFTTLCAIYSNTADTPAPVFADVKKSFGPRSGGVGAAVKANGSSSGVVEAVLRALVCSLANKLGVMVTALPELVLALDRDGIRREAR